VFCDFSPIKKKPKIQNQNPRHFINMSQHFGSRRSIQSDHRAVRGHQSMRGIGSLSATGQTPREGENLGSAFHPSTSDAILWKSISIGAWSFFLTASTSLFHIIILIYDNNIAYNMLCINLRIIYYHIIS